MFTSVQYEYLLEKWEENKENFLLFINLVCGFEKEKAVYVALKKYIHDKNDIQDFVMFFDGDLDNIELAACDYINWRTNQLTG